MLSRLYNNGVGGQIPLMPFFFAGKQVNFPVNWKTGLEEKPLV